MLVGGLAILVAGLVLLTGGPGRSTGRPTTPRRDVDAPAWGPGAGATPRVGTPAPEPAASSRTAAPAPAPAAPATSPDTPAAPCDWSAWFVHEDGHRVALRAPLGAACCTYLVQVRDLDPVTGLLDELEEALTWSGTATRLGPEGAATRLQRDVVTRRASTAVGELFAALSLDRSPGPEVTTPAWRARDDGDDAGAAEGDERRRARLWSLHIDDLHDHGARPAPTDAPRVAPLVHRQRVEVSVTVERGCRTAPHTATITGRCQARLGASVTSPAGRVTIPLVASWIGVDTAVVAANEPTVPPVGLASWHPVADDPAAGVAAVGDPRRRASEAEWTGHVDTAFDEAGVTVTVGSAVHLEIDADDRAPEPVGAEVHATTAAQIHLRIGEAEAGDGCRRCLPAVDLVLGRPAAPGVRPHAPGSTAEAEIRLDGRPFRLRRPDAGRASRSWVVAPADLDVQDGGRAQTPEVTT